ncbi:MAG: magnesium/cobalt transporter CorA [Bacteroidia bacterium]|jgi:magnesium transporter
MNKHKRVLSHKLGGLERPKLAQKAGLAPATLHYTGEKRTFTPWLDFIEYNATDLIERNKQPVDFIHESHLSQSVRWVNVCGIHDTQSIEKIGQILNLHVLVQEDIVHTNQRPKLDEYEDYIYLVCKMIQLDSVTNELRSEQVSVILKDNLLVTFIEDEGDVFNDIRDRIRKGNIKIRKSGADYLLYSVLDVLVDHYFVVLEGIGDYLENLEIMLLEEPRSNVLQELHKSKREIIYLRKYIWPLREVVGLLSKGNSPLLKGNTTLYLRDVYDHCIHVIDTLETFRDVSSGLMDVYLSSISNRMNDVMKTLTIIATIFIPLTFIVGVYGMNFDNMPELHYSWAYPAVWVVMAATALSMLIWFRKNHWW